MMDMQGFERTMVFYQGGFFGFGPDGDFAQWSPAHLAPILVTLVAIVITWKLRDRLRAWRYEENARFLFAFVTLVCEMSYFWRLLYVGTGPYMENNFMSYMPIQICEWTLIVSFFMILKKSPFLFDMTYFLTMSFSLLPLLFPAVISNAGPTYYRYYQFWGEHLLPIYAMFYMMFVHGFRPHPRGIVGALGMVVALGIPGLMLNQAFEGANYLYLKPGAFSMLSFLPDSLPVLIALYLGVVLALMGIDWLVWKAACRFADKRGMGGTQDA